MTNLPKLPRANIHKGFILYCLLLGKKERNKGFYGKLETCNSASRICELRSDGWDISDKFVYSTTLEKKQVREKEYFIKSDKIYEYKKSERIIDFIQRCHRIYGR